MGLAGYTGTKARERERQTERKRDIRRPHWGKVAGREDLRRECSLAQIELVKSEAGRDCCR